MKSKMDSRAASLYGLNGSLSSTRRSNSQLDGLEVTRHRSGVETKAAARGDFEENLTESDRPNVIVWLGDAQEDGGGE
jgi:hypothetical protein